MFVSLINLFIGGSDTTSNTLNWALFHLSKNQAVQKKAAEEIDEMVGKDRLPSLEDQHNTPYIRALVMEIHRIISMAYLGIPREVSRDTTVGKFFIPKVLIFTFHRNKTLGL